MSEDERRVRWVRVGERDVLDWFAMASGGFPQYLTVPVFWLPDGARVLSVHHDVYRRCFAFLVEHPSFAAVPDGEVPPAVVGEGRRQAVEIVNFEADEAVVVGGGE